MLAAALARFGCCPPQETSRIVGELLGTGTAFSEAGHQVRLVAFGSTRGSVTNPCYQQIMLDHVIHFLQSYLRDHWELLRHAQFKDPALGFLATTEKALRVSAL